MARKKSIGKFAVGARVKVLPGVCSPEFPDFPLDGWGGVVFEVSGKKAPVSYVIEWDEATLAAMPQEYVDRCENDGLYFKMICLGEDALTENDS